MKTVAVALGAFVLLACACGREGPLALAAATTLPVAADGGDAATAAASAPQLVACGARFEIPDDWFLVETAPGHWQLSADAAAPGLSASVRCLDEPVSPATHYLDLQAVRDMLGEGPQFDAAFRYYLLWLESSPQRPQALIALRQEQRDGPDRVEVAIWSDDAKRLTDAPPGQYQGMIAVHWSADDPAQVQQYEALRARFDPSFTTTSPRIGRNRANTR